jgi:hypothetical protein
VLHYLVVGNRVLPQDVRRDQAHLVPATTKKHLISLKNVHRYQQFKAAIEK